MNSKQYEELCRFFLAHKLGLNLDVIKSADIPNPRRPNLPEFAHQIDLCWEIDDEIAQYLNIANAKWRTSDKVDQGDVLLIEQVRTAVGAQKAVMLTNSDFTAGAEAAAQHYGIALHIVQPNFDYSQLPQIGSQAIQEAIQQIAISTEAPIYLHRVQYKAFPLGESESISEPPDQAASRRSGTVIPSYSNKMGSGPAQAKTTSPQQGSNQPNQGQGDTGHPLGGYTTKSGSPSSRSEK